jgi:hypothetical protein
MSTKRLWIVVFEKDGEKKLYRIEAVGYSQAITFAGDKMERETDESRTHWEVRRVDSIMAK